MYQVDLFVEEHAIVADGTNAPSPWQALSSSAYFFFNTNCSRLRLFLFGHICDTLITFCVELVTTHEMTMFVGGRLPRDIFDQPYYIVAVIMVVGQLDLIEG